MHGPRLPWPTGIWFSGIQKRWSVWTCRNHVLINTKNMNRNILSIIIAAVVLLIIVMMVIDYSGDRADKRGNNPYEYNVDRYKSVDTSLVHFRESKQIPLGEYKAGGLDLFGGNAWLAGEGFLLSLDEKGRVTLNQDINGEATCLEVTPGAVYIAFEDHIK